MARTDPFQKHTDLYDGWYDEHRYVYEAEVRALRSLLPASGPGLEVGVGTGRFAGPLGIDVGIEPSANMRVRAHHRGMRVLGAVAEHLPFRDGVFGYVIMVTTICFLDDAPVSIREARRVLTEGGSLIVGFVDRTSPVGQKYVKNRHESVFYREATFYSTEEVLDLMRGAGFHDFTFQQTIFEELPRVTEQEEFRPGYGQGSFVALRGRKT